MGEKEFYKLWKKERGGEFQYSNLEREPYLDLEERSNLMESTRKRLLRKEKNSIEWWFFLPFDPCECRTAFSVDPFSFQTTIVAEEFYCGYQTNGP